jgi:hypothetical protein
MIKRHAYLLCIALLSIICIEMQAQSLFLKENNGTQKTIDLITINKLCFSADTLIIEEKDGDTKNYGFNDLRYLNFIDILSNTENKVSTRSIGLLQIYPNPTTDRLNIKINKPKHTPGIIEVLSLEGKSLYFQQIIGTENNLYIDVSQLPHGIYLCKIVANDKTEVVKFIKQ